MDQEVSVSRDPDVYVRDVSASALLIRSQDGVPLLALEERGNLGVVGVVRSDDENS